MLLYTTKILCKLERLSLDGIALTVAPSLNLLPVVSRLDKFRRTRYEKGSALGPVPLGGEGMDNATSLVLMGHIVKFHSSRLTLLSCLY